MVQLPHSGLISCTESMSVHIEARSPLLGMECSEPVHLNASLSFVQPCRRRRWRRGCSHQRAKISSRKELLQAQLLFQKKPGTSEETSFGNPYQTLDDIVSSARGTALEDDDDMLNFALFQVSPKLLLIHSSHTTA